MYYPATVDGTSPLDAQLTVHGFGQEPDDRLSIVVPTKNEAKNVEVLLQRLDRALAVPFEVIFVDDSDDDTPVVIETVRPYHRSRIVLIRRSEDQRLDGLGGAVLRGLEVAQASLVCVMNADLHHPAELVTRMRDEARCSGADLVVVRRAEPGRSTFRPPAVRTLLSRASSFLAGALRPGGRHRSATEPIDFFVLRKDRVQADTLAARGGFKALLDVLTRHPGLQIAEVGPGLTPGSMPRRASPPT